MPTDAERSEEMRRRYLADQVNTGTPAQRLVMLFDRLLRDLRSAEEAFVVKDLKTISDNLVHAQQILFALRDPLDTTTELGRGLRSVYTYCLKTLIEANMKKDPSLLAECAARLEEIAEANRTAASRLATPEVAAVAS